MQREDDKPTVVRRRLEQYEAVTRPVIEFYREKNILKEFSGKTTNEIWPQVEDYLKNALITYDNK